LSVTVAQVSDPGFSGPGRQRLGEIYLAGVRGRRPTVPVGPAALEARARKAMSREAFAYFAGGAGLESTMAANRAAFERWRIVPRMLRDVSVRDMSVELFGRRMPSPFLIAPIGVLELARREADLAVARGAAAEGVPMIFSSQASVAMEDCAAAMGDGPRWFQLYSSASDELLESFVRRAEACGCEAIVVTLDTPMLGWRTRDLELAYLPFLLGKGIAQYTSDPTFGPLVEAARATPADDSGPVTVSALRSLLRLARRYPGPLRSNLRSGTARAGVRAFLEYFSRPSLTWEDVDYLRGLTDRPLLLKGILHPDDAHAAVERGVDGIVVSNHGGRQVDGAIASLDALPAILDAVDGRVPVLLDSGIRGGADAFKALALGARAVLIGRSYAYGLAIAGTDGVREVIRNFTGDLDLTMGLAGCTSVGEITPEMLVPAPAPP
jgi:isopentenyl diphosphate isomerase/L-lactate dehydrogenase-like FMN-dependent dehydrogenase